MITEAEKRVLRWHAENCRTGLYDKNGQCDCCGKLAVLARGWHYGIETYACAECHGYPADEFDEREITK